MIKSIKIFVLLSFVFTGCLAQSFEGKVKYQNAYKSKIPNLTDEQFTAMMGSTQEYKIKDGNYQSSTNGTFFNGKFISVTTRNFTANWQIPPRYFGMTRP